tara:strand:- start:2841 stop:3410 length:570 start_codon:yes stop_codon:yes gene_type:complete
MNKSEFENYIDIAVKRSRNKNYNIKEVAKILNIKYKNEGEICEKIHKFLLSKENDSESLKYFLSLFDSTSYSFCTLLIDSLYELFIPSNISKSSINDKKYKDLIKQKQEGTIKSGDNQLLENNLYSKLCKCIKKIYIKNMIEQEFFNKKNKYNRYAVCTNSIYNKRGFKSPPSATKNCADTFHWYKYNK